MSELNFVNFCISFNKRLTEIMDRMANSKKLVALTEEEEQIIKVLHDAAYGGAIEFGNENRNPRAVITKETK